MRFLRAGLSVLIAVMALAGAVSADGVHRAVFSDGVRVLTVEILDDDLAHFELSGAAAEGGIWTSPMVAKTDYAGPSSLRFPAPDVIETPEMRVQVDAGLCVTLTDLTRAPELTLTVICPAGEGTNALTLTPEGTTDIYGLGMQFQRRGGADGNWFGKRRVTLNNYGNSLTDFEGGKVGSAQFPVMYALGAGHDNYALFLDDVYQQYWAFTGEAFSVETRNSAVRWYMMTGPDLPDLRADYLELTGRPPVPPKQMFGLWVSEYGYEGWAEVETELEALRAADFPLDGFVLDLYWFGGIGEQSGMGGLAWDEENFPNPAAYIANLRENYGLGIVAIEEPYVAQTLPDYADLVARGVLAQTCGASGCTPAFMDAWWGKGGMVDFTDPAAAAYWHDLRRAPLIDDGVIGHWTDLGEPENYVESAVYHGFPELGLGAHADIHNVYNLLWSKSIYDGYADESQRPFILSRSGTAGSQRFSVAMWSGDIAANMPSFAAHLNVQMHMALSGVDYFGADVGGFYRTVFDPVLGQDGMYTLWLANAALMDVPLRPHAQNLQNAYETSPALIGDVASNLANIRLRYALAPYLYTLAHRAYRHGEAVFAPPVYFYQDDANVRQMGSQKMLGGALMMATVTGYPSETVPVYLPAGVWFDTLTGAALESSGESVDMPFRTADGLLRVPLLARDGAIIPQMPVDDGTLNVLGQRTDGAVSHDLIVTVYAAEALTGSFTLIEDDGATTAYQSGAVRETPLSFSRADGQITVTVSPAAGTYDAAPDSRTITVRLITPDGAQEQSADVTAADGITFTFAD